MTRRYYLPSSTVPLLLILFFSYTLNICNGLELENIVGGFGNISEHQFPWVVSINGVQPSSCGGALITTSLILTAAHCVYDPEFEHILKIQYSVIVGTNDLQNKPGKRYYVSKVYTHKDFTRLSNGVMLHDIAILQLKDEAKVSQTNLISLPDDDKETYEGKIGMIAGFGYDTILGIFFDPKTNGFREIGTTNGTLNYVNVKILSNTQCKKRLSTVLCAQAIQSLNEVTSGVCTGDSGNILVVDDKAVGVLNKSPKGCTEKEKPAIYARVTSDLSFIKGVISGVLTSETVVTAITYYSVKIKSSNDSSKLIN